MCSAVHVILGENYHSYEQAMNVLNVEKLAIRRSNLCLKFAKKAEKHVKFSKWFFPDTRIPEVNTRNNNIKLKYKPVPFKKVRYKKSPIPYITQILNEYYSKKKK